VEYRARWATSSFQLAQQGKGAVELRLGLAGEAHNDVGGNGGVRDNAADALDQRT
jgi:hypothetical protein